MFNRDNRFDISLKAGQATENTLAELMLGRLDVEVKAEIGKWQQTGNAAIEYECRGNPSGIAVTKANWWAHCFMDGDKVKLVVILPIEAVKKLARDNWSRKATGGDDNAAKMVLVKIGDMVNASLL